MGGEFIQFLKELSVVTFLQGDQYLCLSYRASPSCLPAGVGAWWLKQLRGVGSGAFGALLSSF